MPIKDQLFLASQYLAPHHLVSRLFGYASDCREPAVKNWMISRFVQRYGVDMSEAEQEDALAYDCFNDFFTRALEGRRAAAGRRTRLGAVSGRRRDQPDGRHRAWPHLPGQGHSYGLADLLGGDAERAAPFQGGEFATIYLSPRDYHRVHMPVAGTLREMVHVPGRLFSVNPLTARNVPRSSRATSAWSAFDTEHGPMALVLVGAMIVASIEIWAGLVTPHKRGVKATRYDADARAPIHLDKGAEMGVQARVHRHRVSARTRSAGPDTPSVRGPVRMGELLALPA